MAWTDGMTPRGQLRGDNRELEQASFGFTPTGGYSPRTPPMPQSILSLFQKQPRQARRVLRTTTSSLSSVVLVCPPYVECCPCLPSTQGHRTLDASSPRVIYGVGCPSTPPSPSSSSPAGIDSSASWQHSKPIRASVP
jgi:hypothetical protein